MLNVNLLKGTGVAGKGSLEVTKPLGKYSVKYGKNRFTLNPRVCKRQRISFISNDEGTQVGQQKVRSIAAILFIQREENSYSQ